MELAVCPFCKAKLNSRLDINYNGLMERWVLMHWCNDNTDTTIMMVADTKEEVIERWNASLNRKDV